MKFALKLHSGGLPYCNSNSNSNSNRNRNSEVIVIVIVIVIVTVIVTPSLHDYFYLSALLNSILSLVSQHFVFKSVNHVYYLPCTTVH